MKNTNLESLREDLLANFNDGQSWEDADALSLTKHGALEVAQHFFEAGIKVAMELVEQEDPSTSRTTSPAYWGNKLRARMNQLLSDK